MRTLATGVIAWVILAGSNPTQAITFTVNSSDDAVDVSAGDGICATARGVCTLRAAIIETNALSRADTLLLPNGKFRLRIRGTDEDAGQTGDLDITNDLNIVGAGENASIVD